MDPFEKVKERMTTLVQRESRKTKIEDAINALKERFEVSVFEENLKYVVIDLSQGRPKADRKDGSLKNNPSLLDGKTRHRPGSSRAKRTTTKAKNH